MGYLSRSAINEIEDFNHRNILLGLYDEIDALHQAQGTNFLSPVNSKQKPAAAVPSTPSISVTGSNGAFNVTLSAPSSSINKQVQFEVSYSPLPSFASGVVTLSVTSATSLHIPAPGTKAYFRARCSYDGQNWSAYAYA